MFEIDLKRFVLQLLPSFYRQPLIFGLLRAAIVGLQEVYNQFSEARAAHIYRLSHNGQVCYLRAVLNDAYQSPTGVKFDILTVERDGEWLYAITEDGSHITLAAPEDSFDDNGKYQDDSTAVPVLTSEEKLTAQQNDFVVTVPSDLYQSNLTEIAALVDKYKLISKRAIYTPIS
jgi:hypothetical protein